MEKPFIHEDFLLENSASIRLYHEYAKKQPIIDFHSHLPQNEIVGHTKFDTLTAIWLYGDHYKWRAMRTLGIDEQYITGNASDWDRFKKWADTVPYTLRNPLYHWTHMELWKPFGITDRLLNPNTAASIYNACNEQLQHESFSARNLLHYWDVEVVCTTDDPLDTLEIHQQLHMDDSLSIQVLPTFRPDKAMAIDKPTVFKTWIQSLGERVGNSISNYDSFLNALEQRLDFFHQAGCRLADHGLDTLLPLESKQFNEETLFQKGLAGEPLTVEEISFFKRALLIHLGTLYHKKAWVQQIHIGVIRNPNSRQFAALGPDTGFDTIGDWNHTEGLSLYFDALASQDALPKTILYNINGKDNDALVALLGSYQQAGIKGKMQYGSAWWFLDHKEGIENQLNSLSYFGLLKPFVGMLTDSRSFLSFSRHDYFRRILCNLLGHDMKAGLIPMDFDLVGTIVVDICYRNAKQYFQFHTLS
jgi:glucuronate isomerase